MSLWSFYTLTNLSSKYGKFNANFIIMIINYTNLKRDESYTQILQTHKSHYNGTFHILEEAMK